MKPTKLIGILLFLILTITSQAYEYEITNDRTKLYSNQYTIDGGSKHTDSGTIYAYAYMSSGKVKIKVATSSGKNFTNNTVFAIYENRVSSSNEIAKSSNMKGKSYAYVTFSPLEADLYVVLATKTSDNKTVGFFINTPIKVQKKIIAPPTLSGGVNIVEISGGFKINSRTASGDNITYKFYRSTRSGSLGSLIHSGSSRYYSDTGLSDGVTYYYTIKACNDGGCATSNQDYRKYESPDEKPTISIQSFPTTVDKTLSSKVEYRDDKALKRISYKIYTYGNTGGSPILNQTLNISGTSYTKNWNIDTSTLADGKYEIMFFVSDEKTGVQSVTRSFTKKGSDEKPTISIQSFPTTVDKTLSSKVEYRDDKALKRISYKIYTYGNTGGSPILNQTLNISGTSYTKNWNIDTSTLADGKYEIMFFVSDEKTGVQSLTRSFTKKSAEVKAPTFKTSFKLENNIITARLTYVTKPEDKYYFDYLIYKKGDRTSPLSSPKGVKTLLGGAWTDWKFSVENLEKGTYEVVFGVYSSSDKNLLLTSVVKEFSIDNNSEDFTEIINYLKTDSLIAKMDLNTNLEKPLSRSDAIILIDGMRNIGKSSIKKDMQEYYNPFADVPQDAEYLPSLMRLAYYKSNFNITTINKTTLFNPMHHTTREEFVKMAISGFDITNHSADLSKFTDRGDITSYFVKYFETAVYNKLLFGNNGKLLPKDKITIKEALYILRRIKNKFASNYPFTQSRYETPESLDLSLLYHKTIGFEYEPRYYKPDATPIKINSISKSKNGDYYLLTVSSQIDTANSASDYYWWSTDKGYFKEEPSSNNYKKVRFYPMSTKPETNYHIVVNGGDNLGYVDSYSLTISKEDFSYNEDEKAKDVLPTVVANLNGVSLENKLVANQLFTVDLSNVSVKKSNIELSVDQVVVTMEYDRKTYQLFEGTPNGKKARFVMGDYADLYGKTVTLKVELYSQAQKYATSKTLTYKPQFSVRGKVYNAVSGTKITAVNIGGKEVQLDENGEFYYTLDRTNEIRGLEIRTKENSEQNHFDPVNIDLTYKSPSKYVVLTGEDSRPSLNLRVSPIHVPSNESVKFTLTAGENIPSNATITLEDSSCNTPSGLGTKKVEITCTTATTDDIKYITMSINSTKLYGDGLSRTVVVDKALNSANAIDTVKNQLSIPSISSENIDLPTEMLGVNISWSSSNPQVISNRGKVTPQDSEQNVTLTATLSKDGVTDTKEFTVTVPKKETTILDTDGDGIPNSTDPDDDNDGISDVDEIKYGLDPLNKDDALYDSDGDGFSNIDEINAGTNPKDGSDYPNSTTKKLKWRAFVSSLNNYIEADEKLSDVIKNGVAYIPSSLSNKSYYWTNFYLDIPKIVDGDNMKFEAKIKCPSSEGGLSAYDTSISVVGNIDKDTNKSAWLTLMDGSWAQSYDSFGAGDTSIRNIPELVKDLQGWHTVAVQTKNGKVSVYYDNQLVKESSYTDSVGKIIRLRIGFKGSGTIDWAKLYENEKVVLEENFNTDGKTTATLNIGQDLTKPTINEFKLLNSIKCSTTNSCEFETSMTKTSNDLFSYTIQLSDPEKDYDTCRTTEFTQTSLNNGTYPLVEKATIERYPCNTTAKVTVCDTQNICSEKSIALPAVDTDGDGIPNSTDPDDDNDGISDVDEIKYGFNPLDPSDATQDADGDGVSNIDEIKAGTNPLVSDINPMTINTQQNISIKQGEEYNLSIDINHTQQQNLDVSVQNNTNSLFTLTPSWDTFEPIGWESYSKHNLNLLIHANSVGEGNFSIILSDEDNRQFNKSVYVSVFQKLSNRITLKRNGWNLVSICQEMLPKDIDMTGIKEIQSQDGKSIYTGEWTNYSNLNKLEAGYGYWVKTESKGVSFDVGLAKGKLIQPLRRTGWNLMASCEERTKEQIDMSEFREIQSQDGKSIYTGNWAKYSNLNVLLNGYGYWVKGDKNILWTSKMGLSIPPKFDYQTINNSGEIVETTFGNLSIKLFVNYNETANFQANHTGIVVRINGQDAPIMQIQDTYRGHDIVVGVYDMDGNLVGVSDITTVATEGSGTFIDVQIEDIAPPIILSNLVSGTINFKDDSNTSIAIPKNAFVRIVPSRFQNNESGWNGLICKIDSNGSYGDECYTDGNHSAIREAFNDSSETFQMVVFKNHINPEDYHWNCGEDVYKYIGDSITSDQFTPIDVLPSDYEDRSSESCGD